MLDAMTRQIPPRFVPTTRGIPVEQVQALDRRHRLERQQRTFRGPHRGGPIESALASNPFAITDGDGPNPA